MWLCPLPWVRTQAAACEGCNDHKAGVVREPDPPVTLHYARFPHHLEDHLFRRQLPQA